MTVVIVLVAAGVVASRAAIAGPRKRVVVLDFTGPKAEQFHDDLVKLLKKGNTVVPTDKWNSTAEDLSAVKPTDKNIKKVAKKLKVDGVIEGVIEKRREQYIVRLKLHEGKTGAAVGKDIDAKANGPHLDGDAAKDVKDELGDAIDALNANRATEGDDAGDDAPKHKKGDDDDDKPKHKVAKGDDDDDDKPKHGGFAHHGDDEKGGDKVGKPKGKGDDDDDAPKHKVAKGDDDDAPKHKVAKGDDDDAPKPKHKVVKGGDDDDAPRHKKGGDDDDAPRHKKGGDDDDAPVHHRHRGDDDGGGDGSATAAFDPSTLTPAARAMDVVGGFSLTDRKLSFTSDADLATPPPGYKGVPVAGGMVDATVYPLAFGHKRHDMLANFGLNLLIDRVIKISSQTSYMDAGATKNATVATEELRVGFGAVFRYPLGSSPTSPVIGGMIRYGKQQFIISHDVGGQPLPDGAVDVPNVHYTMIEIGPFIRLPVTSKIELLGKADFLIVTDAGDITADAQYGGGKVTAFELEAGLDYALTNAIFVRATARVEQFRFSFNGTGEMTNDRSNTPTTPPQNVHGATDSYLGGTVLIGFLY